MLKKYNIPYYRLKTFKDQVDRDSEMLITPDVIKTFEEKIQKDCSVDTNVYLIF